MSSKRTTALVFACLLLVSAIAGEVVAGCNPPKMFMTAYGNGGNYFLNFPPNVNATVGGGVVKARFWQAGARNLASEQGLCPELTYLFQSGPSQIAIYGQSGGDVLGTGPCDNQGCVDGPQIILVQTVSSDGRKAYYAVGKVTETTGDFDYARGGTDWQVTEIPRPRVRNSSRSGTTITVNVEFDPPNGAHGEADNFPRNSILTGYQIVRFSGFSDPGRLPAAWTNVGAVVPVNENVATLVVGVGAVCTGGFDDVFLAMRPVFDGGQFLGDYVGASTRLICNPLVADPRFNPIQRPKSGRGDVRTNPR